MMTAFYLLLLGILIYFVSWTIVYICIVGYDFSYYLKYLKLGWASPGEVPAFIQWGAGVVTIVILSVTLWFVIKS